MIVIGYRSLTDDAQKVSSVVKNNTFMLDLTAAPSALLHTRITDSTLRLLSAKVRMKFSFTCVPTTPGKKTQQRPGM